MAGLFDKVVVGINKGLNAVSEGSKLVIEKAQINAQISDKEKEISQLFNNIGMLVYNLQSKGEINIEQCADMCNELTKVKGSISELQQQLRLLEAQKPQTSTYDMQNENGQQSNNGVTCNCGYTNKVGAKFCANCGQGLPE